MVFGEVTNSEGSRLELKSICKDEVAREMIKGGTDMVVHWIWRLFNMVFGSGVVAEDWRSAIIVPLYKYKR